MNWVMKEDELKVRCLETGATIELDKESFIKWSGPWIGTQDFDWLTIVAPQEGCRRALDDFVMLLWQLKPFVFGDAASSVCTAQQFRKWIYQQHNKERAAHGLPLFDEPEA